MAAGLVLTLMGFGLLASAILQWRQGEFGGLDPIVTMRQVVPALLLITLGVQTLFGSFFLSMFSLVAKNKN